MHGKEDYSGGGTAGGPFRCLGQMLTADPLHCDPQFVAVRIGNTWRFHDKFCHHCRATGIPVDRSRVWLLNPAYEDTVCASVGYKKKLYARTPRNQQPERFWCHSPAVPKRFHLFNDKKHCNGPKLVVLEAAIEGETDALLPVPAPKPQKGDMMDVDDGLGCCVRLWISYGTLTLQKSRKGAARHHNSSHSRSSRSSRAPPPLSLLTSRRVRSLFSASLPAQRPSDWHRCQR